MKTEQPDIFYSASDYIFNKAPARYEINCIDKHYTTYLIYLA
jgi:hypothetical protein